MDGTPFAVSPLAAAVPDVTEPAPAVPLVWVLAAAAALLLVLLLVLRRRRAARPAFDIVLDDDEEVAVGREETKEERLRKQLRQRAADLVRQKPA